MKRSDLYFGLANLFLASEVSMRFESGWMFSLGLLWCIGVYNLFKEGAE